MQKSYKRKLPLGWRRLTPTEKITAECKYSVNDNLTQQPDLMAESINPWSDMLSFHIGKTVKQEWPSGGFTVIKPIKSKAVDTNITPQ